MFLPYYDCIRFAITDPMHNILLGTPKRIFHKQWVASGLIDSNSLEDIQKTVQNCTVPSGIGRTPRKITSNFSNLTADEWKNWTLLFSPIALQNILPQEHLECWQLYISACTIYYSSIITNDDIKRASDLMKSFFVAAESLYGPSFLTINTHLHLHLADVFRDYGPCYGYWLFSFERYNGILGKYHTNQQSIEIQLMRRFIENMHIISLVNPDSLAPEHSYIFEDLLGAQSSGSASDTVFGVNNSLSSNCNFDLNHPNTSLLNPFVLYYFDNVSLSYLRTCYQKFLPTVDVLEIPQLCRKYKSAMWWSQYLKTSKYPKKALVCITANWIGEDGQITGDASKFCAGSIEYFFSQILLVGNDHESYVEVSMAHVKWFQERDARYSFLDPVEIWCNDMFKPFGPASFIPVEKISEVCVTCDLSIDCENVIAINPMRKKIFL